MSTYTQILYQIVFSTKNRESSILEDREDQLFRYIWGLLKARNCHLYRINGTQDHIHIVLSIHPTESLSKLVKDIKVASSRIIKEERLFPKFTGWQEGYGAFTYSFSEKDRLIEYVKKQKEHHRTITFLEEYRQLLIEHGVEIKEEYFP